MTKTLFEKIIQREMSADVVYENDHIIAIKDLYPQAPVHLLIIVKKLIPSLQEMEEGDLYLLQEVIRVAQQLAKEMGIAEGYRLVTNNGSSAGQSIFHLHFHLLGGKTLGSLG